MRRKILDSAAPTYFATIGAGTWPGQSPPRARSILNLEKDLFTQNTYWALLVSFLYLTSQRTEHVVKYLQFLLVESQSFAFAINPLKMDYLFARTEFATSYTMYNFNFAKCPDSKSSRFAIQHFRLYCKMLTNVLCRFLRERKKVFKGLVKMSKSNTH